MNKVIIASIVMSTFVVTSCKNNTQEAKSDTTQEVLVDEPRGKDNIAYQWGKMSLELTGNDTERNKPRPTVTSRFLGLTWAAMFDAWAMYDAKARPMYLKAERRPVAEHTLKNKEIAISHCAYNVFKVFYSADSIALKDFMKRLGYNPDNNSLDPSTPEGLGNLAAKSMLEARMRDGSNQYGDEKGSNGKQYFDYTGYQPVNTPDKNVNIDKWQPKYFSDGKGGKYAPTCLTPFWGKVKPYALDSANQFRPASPPLYGSTQLEKEVAEVVDLQAKLTPENKALVEFMRDGPRSVQQAGHWLIFAQNVSIRDNHTLDEDVKMYYLVETTAMDAFIAAWETKRYYDSARPYALVHKYYGKKMIDGWAGPEKGMQKIKGSDWRPYSPDEFLCPAFPAYVSGHSTVSGGCSKVLELFTGSDKFGEEVRLVPGKMTEPKFISDTITLSLPTFSETANLAGISRVLGGYHIQADNIAGLKLGRDVAGKVYEKYLYRIGVK